MKVEKGEEKRDAKQRGGEEEGRRRRRRHPERSVWKSAEENVGDNLTLRRFRPRTANCYPFPPPRRPSTPLPQAPLAPPGPTLIPSPAIRFVLHLDAYRSESLCIPMTTGRMHSPSASGCAIMHTGQRFAAERAEETPPAGECAFPCDGARTFRWVSRISRRNE